MSIDNNEIEKIAWLARLSLDEHDIPNSIHDLEQILDLVEQMNSLDTRDVEPLAHPMDITARLRADEVTETDQHVYFQQIAPATKDGYYLVPRVIE